MTVAMASAKLRFDPLRFSRRVVTVEEMHRLVAEAAYYCAESRNFAAGHALDDWLVAETAVAESVVLVGPLPAG